MEKQNPRPSQEVLQIKNQYVIAFYKKHKNIDIEKMNIFLCENMEKLLENINPSLNSDLATQIINNMKILQDKVDNVNTLNLNNIDKLNSRLIELKRDNIEDIKMILNLNNVERIGPLIETLTSSLLDKTTILINDIFPKNQENIIKEIIPIISQLQSSIIDETKKVNSGSIDKTILENLLQIFEQKFNQAVFQSQININAVITANDNRIESKLAELRDISNESNNISRILTENTATLSRQSDNSAIKGRISEIQLMDIIHKLFPSGDIYDTSQENEQGDIHLIRDNKPTIVFENKCYTRNVDKREVDKFTNYMCKNDYCGLFLSQTSGISGKENFEINLLNNNVLIYIHNVEYNPNIIKTAIEIIDNLKPKLEQIHTDDEDTKNYISIEILHKINDEYKTFIEQKEAFKKLKKENYDNELKILENLNLNAIEVYLRAKLSSIVTTLNNKRICEFCGYQGPKNNSLSYHYGKCKSIPPEKLLEIKETNNKKYNYDKKKSNKKKVPKNTITLDLDMSETSSVSSS